MLFALVNVVLWPALATGLDYGLGLQDKPGASAAYVLAVALSTYLGGVAFGVASALLSFLALSYFFVGAPRALEFQTENVSGLVLALFVAGAVGYLLVRERHAKERNDALLEDRRARDAERERRLEQERFLAQAGVSLARSLDYEETLGEIARLAVPRLADWCTIDLLDDDGCIANVAVAHADPDRVAHARSLQELFPPDPEASTGVPNVLRTGASELYAEVDRAVIDSVPDEELRSIVRDLELRSAMIVPLAARGRVLGAISFFLAEYGSRYDEQDLRFAEELARHAALAIDNGRLHRAEQDARAALQVVAERLDRLHRVAAGLAKAVTVPDALNVILGEGIVASEAVAGVVGLVAEDGETVEIVASRGYPEPTIRAWRSFSVNRRLPLSDVVRTGRAFFCESQAERDAHWPTFAGVGASHAFVALPLAVRGTVRGAVALTFGGERHSPLRSGSSC